MPSVIMAEGTKADGPPQPILIEQSAILGPSVEEDGLPLPVGASTTPPNYDAQSVEETLAKVRFLEGNKPSVAGMYILATILMFVFPFLLFVGTDADILFSDSVFICCGSMVAGALVALVAELNRESWKKSVLQAKSEALRAANQPVAEVNNLRGLYVAGGLLFIAGLAFDLVPVALAGLALMVPPALVVQRHKANVAHAFSRLEKEIKNP